ncbi:YciI family protein [Sphingopyxis sp. JAI128]|uniref:YciI family protein n=1 Tax=Sphingopyxis sp. JAI128 TaxID=2723066 RepID=UPI00160BA307|nr:YciI family protein [Sphingopyxis sp. JAI128]MBB6426919.1 uncharacterized protein YciI [Sphingopyxis sp. JAI128]
MYALAIVRYRCPIDQVAEEHRQAHRDYLLRLKSEGVLIASGPFKPHHGGALLLRVGDDEITAALNRVRDDDPFTELDLAQYELLAWDVKTGVEELDGLSITGS